MNKKEFITYVSKLINCPYSTTENYLTVILKSITETALSEKITLKNFGTFELKEIKTQERRNPKTGEKFVKQGYRTLGFKASKQIYKKDDNHDH